jgi:hypothetical protein
MDPVARINEAPTGEVIAAGSGDQCANCGQPLASDQRYCVNCGERRGTPRFSFSALAGQAAAPASAPPRTPRRPRVSEGVGFIAGVATLLLAMGVGVLIGHNTSSSKLQQAAATPPQQVIKIEGGGSSSPANGSSSQTNHTASNTSLPSSKVTLSKKQTQAVNKAVTNVLGGGAKNLPPPTIQPGQTCAHGAGCQGGKFTGNFFGGGQN